jgi:hypothetical protein
MKIPSGHYHEINKIRDEILMEAEDELKNNQINYEVVLNGNMKVILSETPMAQCCSGLSRKRFSVIAT